MKNTITFEFTMYQQVTVDLDQLKLITGSSSVSAALEAAEGGRGTTDDIVQSCGEIVIGHKVIERNKKTPEPKVRRGIGSY